MVHAAAGARLHAVRAGPPPLSRCAPARGACSGARRSCSQTWMAAKGVGSKGQNLETSESRLVPGCTAKQAASFCWRGRTRLLCSGQSQNPASSAALPLTRGRTPASATCCRRSRGGGRQTGGQHTTASESYRQGQHDACWLALPVNTLAFSGIGPVALQCGCLQAVAGNQAQQAASIAPNQLPTCAAPARRPLPLQPCLTHHIKSASVQLQHPNVTHLCRASTVTAACSQPCLTHHITQHTCSGTPPKRACAAPAP